MSEQFPIDGSRDALWMTTAVAAPPTSELTDHIDCDVAVIGGGLTGLNAAVDLADKHFSVAVVEANGLGFGASGRSGGQVNLGLNLGPKALLEKFGQQTGTRLIDLVIKTPDTVFERIKRYQLDCDPVQNGWVQGAVDNRQLKSQLTMAAEYREHGCDLEELDAETLSTRTGTSKYIGGLSCHNAGSLHPLSYTRELARVAMTKGAKIFTHSKVTGIDNRKDNQWVITTNGGSISCNQVLVCTNGYTDNVVPGLSKKVVPVRSVLAATEPLSDSLRNSILPNQITFVDKRRLILYFRYDRAGRLCVGDHGPMRDEFCIEDFNDVKQRAIDVFPQLATVKWDYHWGGRVAMTKSTLPFLHNVAPGLTAGMGYNGRGIGMGTMMGKALAESIYAKDKCAFPVTTPKPFMMHRFHSAGVSMTVKWMALRDHIDSLIQDDS